MSRRWGGAVTVALALLAGACLFAWPLLVVGADRRTIGPADGDLLRQFHPYRAFVARSWASGEVPVWNSHQYAGTPAWADPQQAVVYPWRLLDVPWALGGRTLPVDAVELEAIAHLALAGVLVWALLRALGARSPAAAVSGIGFAFGGYLTGYPLEQLAVLDSAAWIPGALAGAVAAAGAAAEDGGASRSARLAVLAGAATAMSILAGHPQTALYGLYAVAAVWAVAAWRSRPGWRAVARPALLWAVLGAGLSAPAWVPAAALAGRAATRFAPGETGGLPAVDLTSLVAPHATSWWSPLHVGAVSLVLAAWALWHAPRARWWAALAGGAWLVSLGSHAPWYGLWLRAVPGMAAFRHHERAAVLFSLGLAVAAGLAVDQLARAPRESARRAAGWLAAAAAALTLAAVVALGASVGAGAPDRQTRVEARCAARPDPADEAYLPARLADPLALSALALALAAPIVGLRAAGRLSGRAMAVALAVTLYGELYATGHGWAFCPTTDRSADEALAAAALPHARDGRVSSEGLLGGPNAASVLGLYDVTGDSPIRLARYAALEESVPEIVRWRLLGVRYVASRRTFPPDAPVSEMARSGDRALYEVRLGVPPAWVPARTTALPAAGWVPAPSFDPLAEAPVEPGADGLPGTVATVPGGARTAPGRPGDASPPVPAAAAARLVGLSGGTAAVEAELPTDGIVVLSAAYDPGWRARARSLDGGAELSPRVVPAYGALLAVPLPAGRWRVEWTYLPAEVIVGLVLGLAAIVLGVAVRRGAA